MKSFCSLLFLIGFVGLVLGQAKPPTDNQEAYQAQVYYTNQVVTIDGELQESIWEEAIPARDFWQKWPTDTAFAAAKTEVRIAYDENFLYVSAINYDNGSRFIETLKRDTGHWGSDGFAIVLDPVNERSNGFIFGVNAGGAQMEGLISMGAGETISENWDAKWYSQTKEYADYWVVEMAIPFKSLRYKTDVMTWGVNFIRNDMERNVYSTWAKVPLQMDGVDLGFTGALNWTNPPPLANGNIVLIPYVTGGSTQNFEDNEPHEFTYNAGLDAKIAVTSSLNLDVTINPDFSQVDVDRQVTNLSRFSLFFPERRNFFLENSDLFSNFGTGGIRPFFSRRIGLENGEQIPIRAGLRLSGNLTNDLRIGIMNIQTEKRGDVPEQNFFVATLQQRVLKRSSINALIVNKESFNLPEESDRRRYNRVAAFEFRYLSQDGKWRGHARYHRSFTPDNDNLNNYFGQYIEYQSRNFWVGLASEQVGRNYIAETGFTPRIYNYDAVRDTTERIGYLRVNPWAGYNFRPENSKILNQHGPRAWTRVFYNENGAFNERNSGFGYNFNFKNTSGIWMEFNDDEIALPFPIEIVGDNLFQAENYRFQSSYFEYWSDRRRNFSGNIFVRYGGFYTGERFGYGGGINFRKQPFMNISITYNRNEIMLPEEFEDQTFELLGTTIEFSFSNTMFWTTFMQYNTQGNNFGINSRFQWRFKPMSDLFIVYTDNYIADTFAVQNRAIVLKLNYWLNL